MIGLNSFHFRGESSGDYDIIVQRVGNVLLPEKRVKSLIIAGRNGTYDQSDGTYGNRQITFDCAIIEHKRDEARERMRRIASWLSEKGELVIDSEPDKHYDAYVSGPIDIESEQSTKSFQIVFTAFPFALSRPRTVEADVTQNEQEIPVCAGGTAKAPCIITIKNVGSAPINDIQIGHRMEVF